LSGSVRLPEKSFELKKSFQVSGALTPFRHAIIVE
jgi:hypothetical protein